MRVAFLADLHLQPERQAFDSVRAAFASVYLLSPQPELMVIAGDFVRSSVNVELDRAEVQWELWRRIREEFCLIPIVGCLGNQDCWGWNQKQSRCDGSEPLFGKALAQARIPLERPFYAMRMGSWRLIVLDSVQRGSKHGFLPELDLVQRAWLGAELEAGGQIPTAIVSHVPIVAGPAEFAGAEVVRPNKAGDWVLGSSIVHADGMELASLFRRYSNVKICLAGHTHVPQCIEFGGISFVVIPPLSGAWWRGPFQGFPPGYLVVDFDDDGTFQLQVVDSPCA